MQQGLVNVTFYVKADVTLKMYRMYSTWRRTNGYKEELITSP